MPEADFIPFLSNSSDRYPDPALGTKPEPKFLGRVQEALGSRHYGRKTEQTCCHLVKRFIYFHSIRHPVEMAEKECLFSIEKLLILLLALLRYQALIHKDYKIVVRILFNCQRAFIMGKWKYTVNQSCSIESP